MKERQHSDSKASNANAPISQWQQQANDYVASLPKRKPDSGDAAPSIIDGEYVTPAERRLLRIIRNPVEAERWGA